MKDKRIRIPVIAVSTKDDEPRYKEDIIEKITKEIHQKQEAEKERQNNLKKRRCCNITIDGKKFTFELLPTPHAPIMKWHVGVYQDSPKKYKKFDNLKRYTEFGFPSFEEASEYYNSILKKHNLEVKG